MFYECTTVSIKRVGKAFLQIFEEITDKCNCSVIEFFDVVVRRIWLRRNAVVHGEAFVDPNQLIRQATAALEEYKQANVKASGVSRNANNQCFQSTTQCQQDKRRQLWRCREF